MKSIGLLSILLILVAGTSFSQGSLAGQTYTPPQIISPPPNAAAIEKFLTIPVSYSTGIPNISYPFWNWSKGRLSLSLGLSYHAGGHKVDDMASNVGLGWALNGLGRVTRTVKGIPDEKQVYGYLSSEVPDANTYNYNGQYYRTSQGLYEQTNAPSNKVITDYNTSYSYLIKDISESTRDGEQDIFSYSFGSAQGRFVINKNKQVVPLEYTNSKIISTFSYGNPSGAILGFQITDDNGLIYKFDFIEWQTATTYQLPPTGSIKLQSYASSWLLTKIIDPFVNDSIVFNYTTNQLSPKYETDFSESSVLSIGRCEGGNSGPLEIPLMPTSYPMTSETVFSFSSVVSNDPVITSINCPDGSVIEFDYTHNRLDYVNTNALTNLRVKNSFGEVVKKFQLNYSYFNATSELVSPGIPTVNDYSKRLRLDNIQDIAVNDVGVKLTSFTYNELPLNIRVSRNKDFWGYNINPSRNNLSYIPYTKFTGLEIGNLGAYGDAMDGADRTPDSTYIKAGVLEKITYPTGGYTQFDYEINKAFSPIDYYENKVLFPGLGWTWKQFGNAQIFNETSRTNATVQLTFKVTELDVRPTPDPNAPQSCFEESQDMAPASFVITSTDNSFTTTIQGVYSNFLGAGQTRILELPLGKTYTISFVYDILQSCSFQYPFTASAEGFGYTAPMEKMASGLRIKQVTFNDGITNTLVKQYDYNENGRSSATLNSVPDFGYYRTTNHEGATFGTSALTYQIHRTSNPTVTLSYFNGSPLIYEKVKEVELNGATTERIYDKFQQASSANAQLYPYPPNQEFQNLSGMLRSETVKDNLGNIITSKAIGYNKTITPITGAVNRNLKTGVVATGSGYSATYYVAVPYNYYTTHANPIVDTSVFYENGRSITRIQNSEYTGNNYLRSVSSLNSKQQVEKTNLVYPFDSTGTYPYDMMIGYNWLNNPVNKLNYIDNNFKTSERTIFDGWAFFPESIKRTIVNQEQTLIKFFNYDGKGNVRELEKTDGVREVYLWGYQSRYPVVKITGSDYSTVMTKITSLQSQIDAATSIAGNDANVRLLLNSLRTAFAADKTVQVSTYTYRPLVGVTSETDPAGRTIYYEYDAFNRLKQQKDEQGNILKIYCYNYAGQPVDCNQ